jgi:uncharacterized protein
MKQVLTANFCRERFLQIIVLPLLSFIFALGVIVAPANATGVYDLPVLGAGDTTWVVDQADVISLANEGKLNNEFNKLAKETGKEVRLVAIRRLDFEQTIDTFADALFTKWYPTPEEQADQVLLVLDTLTNKTAIRTGEEVKTILPDEIAQSVTSETVAIPLKVGSKYNEAFLGAGDRLVAVLLGKPDPGAPTISEINIESTFASAEETDDRSATVWVVVLLVLATAIPMVTYFWYAAK